MAWPTGFQRIPDDDWVVQPVESLALKYDKVEMHGWYRNLDTTVEDLAGALRDGQILIDYSGGTGILASRLLARIGTRSVGIAIVDSSPKFLRLALEKFRDEPRLAFRLLRFLKDRKRLQLLDEVFPLRAHGIVSTNAIHLYYDLVDTLRSWHRSLLPGATVFVQSGNIQLREPGAREWIIDDTVAAIHRIAAHLVESEERYAEFRPALSDAKRWAAASALREKIFLPAKPLEHYEAAFREAGFQPVEVRHRRIEARVAEWYEFLSVYHEGVIGWAGTSEKLDGRAPSEAETALRLELMRHAMSELFGGREQFRTVWTYLTFRR